MIGYCYDSFHNKVANIPESQTMKKVFIIYIFGTEDHFEKIFDKLQNEALVTPFLLRGRLTRQKFGRYSTQFEVSCGSQIVEQSFVL